MTASCTAHLPGTGTILRGPCPGSENCRRDHRPGEQSIRLRGAHRQGEKEQLVYRVRPSVVDREDWFRGIRGTIKPSLRAVPPLMKHTGSVESKLEEARSGSEEDAPDSITSKLGGVYEGGGLVIVRDLQPRRVHVWLTMYCCSTLRHVRCPRKWSSCLGIALSTIPSLEYSASLFDVLTLPAAQYRPVLGSVELRGPLVHRDRVCTAR